MLKQERQFEEQWLKKVTAEIWAQLHEAGVSSALYRRRAHEVRRLIWEDLQISSASRDIYDELAQHLIQLGEERGIAARKYYRLRKLLTMKDSPYFGRFDFQAEGSPAPEMFYIGLGSFVDSHTGHPLVYDWRAPISSLYYDYGLGYARYEAPGGEIRGTVTKKRQYKIENGKLAYMIDTDITIADELLQRALSAHADESLRSIVTTIQREQNQAIRYEEKPILVVTGPAGSGKTSVAMHRIAYLLYRHRQETTANDVIIFSPSNVFSEYIANVLPELGEENVLQTTFQAFAEATLGGAYQCESLMDFQEQLATASAQEAADLAARLVQKSSREFLQRLEQAVKQCPEVAIKPRDVFLVDKLIMSEHQLKQQIVQEYSYLPLAGRLAKVRRRLVTLMRPVRKAEIQRRYTAIREEALFHGEGHWEWARKAIAPVRQAYKNTLSQMDRWLRIDPLEVYLNMLSPQEQVHTAAALKAGTIPFEDAAPILFLKGKLEGFPAQKRIRQVVIDEGQDYSALQLRIIYELFPKARFTILGDENQVLNPGFRENNGLALAPQVFPEEAVGEIHLTKAYRSTQEIANFCLALLPDAERKGFVPMVRRGAKPVVIGVKPARLKEAVSQYLQEVSGRACASIAVICRSARQAEEAHGELQPFSPSLITDEYSPYRGGLVVIPYYLAKGLEFDAVVVWDAGALSYGEAHHRYQLYVACSRALHELAVFYTGEPSPFLAKLPANLYDRR
ncbi:MAG: HelD family protein [Limnochordia bacterium]